MKQLSPGFEHIDTGPHALRIFVYERGYPEQRGAARSAVVDIFANAALRWLCRDLRGGGSLRVERSKIAISRATSFDP